MGDTREAAYKNLEHLTKKVTLVYRVDLRDVPDPYLGKIFKRIQAKREAENWQSGEAAENQGV